MEKSESSIKLVLKEIRANENGPAVDAMERMGLNYNRNFGVSLSRLSIVAEKYKPNHILAEQLRQKNIRETLILSTMIDDPILICEKDADSIVSEINTNELAEQSCINLFEKLDFIDKKAFEWIQSDKEFTIVSGFIIFSRIALNNLQKDDVFFIKLLPISEKLSNHNSIFIRKAIARALRQIALRNDYLKKQVLRCLDQIKENQSENSKLIIEEVIPLIDF